MPESKTLTYLQRRYCEARAAGLKGTDALRKVEDEAGRKPRSSYKAYTVKVAHLNGLPHVQAYMAELERKAAERAGVTVESVLTDLIAIKNRCMQAEPVLDREGNPTGEYQFREHGAIKALELLGKALRMFSESLELSGPGGGPLRIQRIERVIVNPENPNS